MEIVLSSHYHLIKEETIDSFKHLLSRIESKDITSIPLYPFLNTKSPSEYSRLLITNFVNSLPREYWKNFSFALTSYEYPVELTLSSKSKSSSFPVEKIYPYVLIKNVVDMNMISDNNLNGQIKMIREQIQTQFPVIVIGDVLPLGPSYYKTVEFFYFARQLLGRGGTCVLPVKYITNPLKKTHSSDFIVSLLEPLMRNINIVFRYFGPIRYFDDKGEIDLQKVSNFSKVWVVLTVQ